MKFSALLVLLLLSPASAFASKGLISNLPHEDSAKNEALSVAGLASSCASPDKMLREVCMKKPDTGASPVSAGSDTFDRVRPSRVRPTDHLATSSIKPVKPVKITPLVKPRGAAVVAAKPGNSTLSPELIKKPIKVTEGPGSALHKPSGGGKG